MAEDMEQNEGEKKSLKYLHCSKYSNVTLPTNYHLSIVLKHPKRLI